MELKGEENLSSRISSENMGVPDAPGVNTFNYNNSLLI